MSPDNQACMRHFKETYIQNEYGIGTLFYVYHSGRSQICQIHGKLQSLVSTDFSKGFQSCLSLQKLIKTLSVNMNLLTIWNSFLKLILMPITAISSLIMAFSRKARIKYELFSMLHRIFQTTGLSIHFYELGLIFKKMLLPSR